MGVLRAFPFLAVFALATAVAGAFPVAAPAQTLGRLVSPILTIDRDQLFAQTEFGQRVNRELEAASAAMAAESRKIEAALEEEERQITEQRATLDPAAFRELAAAFEEKVQALRQERDSVEANLRRQIEAAQTEFFEQIGPILGSLVRERGAVMILDRRAILLSAADVDITADAIERIDAVLGEGGSEPAPAPAPEPADPALPLDTIPAPQTGTQPPATDSDAQD